ncbi:probable LRR receptor-like serine/threonine-protein kinase At4g29180 isoform X2 [Gossypium hirsutum]|uniref:non-specific serine/threonine protein kinase n=1 Tax=Gossypium hirsutum TaxID=3635 RepID=A0ABM3BVV3_GOSHI|nr:probable LRR receptor-like serine/threonine-protein kinase At4g29180 isoform X2 [Gossypium hirsutum]
MFVGYLTPLLLSLAVLVHGQLQTGFISIDCGSPVNFNFVDVDTGISYTPDGAYVSTGINNNISSEYAYPNNPNLAYPLSDLRSFPDGNKNCYTLTPAAAKGSLYLLRASFLYGNYDGEDKLPEFDLYLDANLWSSIKFGNAFDVITTEIISASVSDTISVCLVNKGLGIPFISALELRPLNNSIYGTELGSPVSLVLFERFDIGYTKGTGRYNDDIYDRIWSPYNSPSWNIVSTSSEINNNENGYRAPLEVIRTAAVPRNGSDRLEFSWTADDDASKFYVYMYFAEVQLAKNQTRKFNISWNGSLMFGPLVPRYLFAATISNSEAFTGKEHHISIYKTVDANLPPILNAVEIYMAKQLDELPTFSEDVAAVLNIKTAYQVNKGWVGDPCGPKNYTWEGLECNYSVSLPPRIISLSLIFNEDSNLTSSGLSGIISASFANITSMESLDLSNNHLSGPVPEFLKELKSLKFMNLEGNQLSGSVPTELVDRSKAGLLTLRVDEQNLCSSGSCKNKKNVVVPVVASLLSALVLCIALIILWRLRRKQKWGRPLPSKNRQFTYAEVLNITNNFQDVIGKGGFGTVFRGNMKDGTQVAVKMLSTSSKQGSKEFQAEAELLMRVHHRNLASFIGYCDEGSNMALIYEYMANGNLKDYLSYKSSNPLSWEMRLRIAIHAAQGLEYLHHGCKPPIIHRDVKTANILLSENMDAKIADFGLSRAIPSDDHSDVIITTVMGTPGYLDPEYYNSRKLNEKSDVFSFGIVLLELITGQNAVIKKDESIHIVNWVSPLIEREDIGSIVDQRLHGEFDVSSAWKALEVAMACTRPKSLHRATMSTVLTELNQCLAMELSHNRETKERFSEEIYIGPYNSSEVCSTSTTSYSITRPFAR